ncbi:MAG: PLP-dependent aspartate aminotransferase family protein [Deltaproteobacteria bacterium]|nr:PLP-dependent aspartate aminotransferase family protein [Deltaproteobacteria bacterium]
MTAVETLLVHRPRVPGEPAGASSTPIYQTATFSVSPGGDWDYSRSGNPTRDVLEQHLARLDGAARSLAYASGMAAVAAVLRLAPAGSEVVAGCDLYGGSLRFLAELARDRGVEVRLADTTNLTSLRDALSPRTSLVWLETPSNPRLGISDIKAICTLAHGVGAWVAVDNSIHSPYLQKPLEEGADLAVQSATKALGGHSDLTAGVVSVSDPVLGERLAFRQNAEGNALSPFESWLLLRGMETLAVRLPRQLENARYLTQRLRAHRATKGLYTSPKSFLVSLETASVEESRRVIASLRLFRTTVSFGGVTSSASLPCEMSHASVPKKWRGDQGLSPSLIRLSIGIEDPQDLWGDLLAALDGAAVSKQRRAPESTAPQEHVGQAPGSLEVYHCSSTNSEQKPGPMATTRP